MTRPSVSDRVRWLRLDGSGEAEGRVLWVSDDPQDAPHFIGLTDDGERLWSFDAAIVEINGVAT